MRVVFALIALIVLSTAVALSAQSPVATCTASGDPHYTTFDGVRHDFQGSGVYTYVNNTIVSVQANQIPCNPNARRPVTCIREVSVRVTSPRFGSSSVIKWGLWNIADPVNVDGELQPVTNCINSCPVTPPSDDFPIADLMFNTSTNQLTVTTRGTGVTVRIGRFFVAVTLPRTDTFIGQTKGLCGFFDGIADNDFTNNTGDVVFPAVAGQRYNSPAFPVNEWGVTFAADGVNNQLLNNKIKNWNVQFSEHIDHEFVVFSVPEPSVDMTTIQFADFQQWNAVKKMCENGIGMTDPAANENCLYDSTTVGGMSNLAASNGIAAQVAADASVSTSSSSSSLSSNEVVGVAVGLSVFAALLAVVALVLFFHLRKAKSELSKALIRRESANNVQTDGLTLQNNI